MPSKSCTYCGSHPKYDHTQSTTYVKNNSIFNIKYGSGPVSGFWSMDDAFIGDIQVKHQTFAEITEVKGLGQA